MPRRVIGGLILSMALAAGVSSSGASVAAGGATPSPQALGALQESLASEPQIRLTGSFGSREIERPVLGLAIAPIVVGPIVGADIGRSHGHWRTVYPPPNPSSDP